MFRWLLPTFALAVASCSASGTPRPAPTESAPREVVDDAARSELEKRGVEGTFVLLHLKSGNTFVVAPEIANEGFLPCSTFKIPNTLLGLETGVIPDGSFSLKWDGVVRPVEEWNRDHDLASAMKHSVVWFYQEVARRIGEPRMREGLKRLRYGNGDLGAGIDRFWLEGSFRISAREQVDFLRRLRARELMVRVENAALVERILPREEGKGATLRAKTGLGEQGGRTLGWLVGFVDRENDAWAFATLLLGKEGELKRLIPLRLEVTKALLARFGAWP